MSRTDRLALAAWSALVVGAIWWGRTAVGDDGIGLASAPFAGVWDWHLQAALVVPALVAASVVWCGPVLAAQLPWRAVPVVTSAVAFAWTASLAASDGWSRIAAPLEGRFEYEQFADTISSAGTFVRTFTDQQDGLPIHVKGHPPGATLVPWALDQIGLGGVGWFALLALVAWAVAVGAALVAARAVAGEPFARRAAPALALLPAALWAGTSADAVFAAVAAVGIALAVSTRGRRTLAGGAVLGGALMLTYGAVPLLALPGVAQLRRRRVGSAVAVGLGAAGVLALVWVATGFVWFDGLEGTRRAYWRGVASRRPAGYLVAVGNPAALAMAVGPAVAAGLVTAVRRWRDAASLLPLVALVGVAMANASLLSKGEVERIWLPFMPWLGLAASGRSRGWLAAQAALALVLQAALVSQW